MPSPGTQNQPGVTPLAASFVAVPPEHDGETEFWLELSFDAAAEQGSKQRIRALLGASGGSVTRLRRKDDRLDHWRVRVEPSSHEAVTVTLSPSPAPYRPAEGVALRSKRTPSQGRKALAAGSTGTPVNCGSRMRVGDSVWPMRRSSSVHRR